MTLEDKIIWTILTTIIGFLSFYGFQYLHNFMNSWMLKKHPETVQKFPWLFTNSHHKYVFAFVILKISAVVILLWLQIVTMPNIVG